MTNLTPFDALDIVESCLEHFADDPLVAEAAAVLAAALAERERLRGVCEAISQIGRFNQYSLEQAMELARTAIKEAQPMTPVAEATALAERDALRASLRVLLDWCETFLNDEKHLIGSICKEADDAQFRAAIKQAREALG